MTKQYVTDEGARQTPKTKDQINEDKLGNLPEEKFRVVIVKMIQNLRNRMEKIKETFNKDLEELKQTNSDEQHTY